MYTYARVVKGVRLLYMFTQVVSKISPYTSKQRVERPLYFAESAADQLCILGVYLKKLHFGRDASLFTGIRSTFAYNLRIHVEEAYAFHDPCSNGGDAPLSLYASYAMLDKIVRPITK